MCCRVSHKVTLILDLDETLVHSSFKPVAGADWVVCERECECEYGHVCVRTCVRESDKERDSLLLEPTGWYTHIYTLSPMRAHDL